MTEHSKTPWRVFVNKDGTKLVGIGKQDGEGILDAGFGVWAWNDPEGIANAHFVVRAVNSHDALIAALQEISEGKGRFSQDHFQHAKNTIEDMKALAVAALKDAQGNGARE